MFRLRRLEQEEGDRVWRTLESHTRRVVVHGARRLLQIATQADVDKNQFRISEYALCVQYAKNNLVFVGLCTLPAQKHWHTRGTAYQRQFFYEF